MQLMGVISIEEEHLSIGRGWFDTLVHALLGVIRDSYVRKRNGTSSA